MKYPKLEKLHILHYPDPRLREHAENMRKIDSFLKELAGRMNELMDEAQGVGLAAPQLGCPFRLVVLNTEREPGHGRAFINPVIVAREGRELGEEGCLSVPGVWAKVRRATKVRVRALTPEGEEVEMEAEGLLARAWQHELDHLEGGLFVDRIGTAARIMLSSRLRELEDEFTPEPPDEEEAKK